NDLIDVNSKYMQQELKLQQARKNSNVAAIDSNEKVKDLKAEQKATESLEKSYKQLDAIQEKLSSMQKSKGFLDNDMIERTNALLSETRSKLDSNGIQSDFREVSNLVELLNSNLRELNTGNTLSRQETVFNASLQNMESRIDSFIDKCREMGNADHLIERVEQAFRSIDTSNIERANVDLRQMTTTLQQAEREARQLSSTMNNGRTFFGDFGSEFRDNLFTFTAGELLADGIRSLGHSLTTLVKDYDTAFANLKKVADYEDVMNISQLDEIERKAVSIAKNVGQSSQDVIQAIADTIQMGGYGMNEATQIAEQTMMLANVAEMTQQAASEGVVTMLSAFKLDPLKEIPLVVNGVTQSTDELTDSMDKLNYIGNNFAVSSSGLLDAIQSGANVLAEYGVGMNDTLAMIAGANSTLQNTSKVGNGLKTIAINLSGMKVNAREGTLELNKTAKALQEIAGIDVYSDKSKGEVKEMMTILDELQLVWGKLREDERLALSEGIAGKQQAAVFASLMSNFETVKKAQSELDQGFHFGSAIAENEQYISSISGKLNTLKETWVGVFNTIFNSEAFKSFLDVLISVSEVIAKIITSLDEVGMLTPMLLALGGALTTKLFGNGITNAFNSMLESSSRLVGIIPNLFSGFSGISRMMNTTATATTIAGGAAASTATTLASLTPVLLGVAGALGALAIGLKVYDSLNESLNEEKQRLEESISTRKSEIDSIEQQKKSLGEIADEYDKLKNKPAKTNDEVERLKELTNEVAKIMPELIIG
ncbi:MAG: phage tail tape measure protein, partial [Sarcina sp.]